MIRWYEKSEGHTSCMRIIAMMVTITGIMLIASGVVLVYMGNPDGLHIVTIGGGMVGLSEVSKAGQAFAEK